MKKIIWIMAALLYLTGSALAGLLLMPTIIASLSEFLNVTFLLSDPIAPLQLRGSFALIFFTAALAGLLSGWIGNHLRKRKPALRFFLLPAFLSMAGVAPGILILALIWKINIGLMDQFGSELSKDLSLQPASFLYYCIVPILFLNGLYLAGVLLARFLKERSSSA